MSTPQKGRGCTVGWIAHYMIGIVFAVGFMALAGNNWLHNPTLITALLFGVVTVSAPFFMMLPSFAFGSAASSTSSTAQAGLRSLVNHGVFGFGLDLFGLLVNWLMRVLA